MQVFPFVLLLLSELGATLTPRSHDTSFTPNVVLKVNRRNASIGGIQRYTTIVNDTLPGPEVRIPENKLVWIRVYNDMTDANLTMHWHGLAQAAYPFSDGTPLASQWPIPPQHFFDHELQTPNGTAGSYFYHSHVNFQTVSASGPLIVEDNGTPPYNYDDERIVYLQELFNGTDAAILQGLQAKPFVWSGETNGYLVNGKTISNYGSVDPSSKALSVISVDPGKTYRFRFIAATSLSYASFAFQNHTNLTVIEADGGYTKPHSTSLLQMGTGQRFDTLFTTKTCDELKKLGWLDYYMQIESRARPTVVTNYAILRYNNSCGMPTKHLPINSYPTQKPIDLPPTIQGFLDYVLEPLHPNDFPSALEVTRRVIINVQQIFDFWSVYKDDNVTLTEDALNPRNHTTPSKPYLVALYENQTTYLPSYEAAIKNDGVDPKTQTFPAKIGEVVEVVLQNIGSHTYDGSTGGGLDAHPWHAHNSHFYDAGAGDGAWDAATMEARLNRTHPVRRDTTMLFRYTPQVKPNQQNGWRAWRLRIDDPGVWMIHCHTLQHMLMGMQTVWVFGDAKDLMKVPQPDVSGYLTYGGNVYGNSTHAPQVLHFSESEEYKRI